MKLGHTELLGRLNPFSFPGTMTVFPTTEDRRCVACLRFACLSFLSIAVNSTAQVNPAIVGGMKWRQIGPFRGGRVLAVAGVPGDPNTYYFGAVAGGIFKSTNGGLSWTPTFDHESISSIGAIAVADSDHNILYAGSGEACLRGNISYGDGVYKSTDAGLTWKNVGLKDTRHIGAVIIDPRNPDIVLVAALGHAWGPNSERGVFRTADGGKTWQKVLYKDDNTGAIDVVFDPRNSSVVYAALWQVRRQPWYFNSGGPGSGLYKSVDGGLTWKQLAGHGLPEGNLGRIGISVSGADSNRVYALIEAKEGGLYRSDDAGNSWTRVNDDERYRQRAWYFTSRVRRSQAGRHGVCAEHRRIPLHRRRQDLRAAAGAARRSSRAVDRSHQSATPHQQQRWRGDDFRGRRQDLDAAEQSADRAVLPCRRRQPLALSRVWSATGQQHSCHRQPVPTTG